MKCVTPAFGGVYYPTHLPILGQYFATCIMWISTNVESEAHTARYQLPVMDKKVTVHDEA